MRLLYKNFTIFIISVSLLIININSVHAIKLLEIGADDPNLVEQEQAFAGGAGFTSQGRTGISNIVAAGIKASLGLLGVIFIILIIASGYQWMTAGGNEEKVAKARQTIIRAAIGLTIIVAAYAITHFVFINLPWGTGYTGGAT